MKRSESDIRPRPQLNQHGFFVDLLRLYAPDRQTLIELLGFKYKYYMSTPGGEDAVAAVPDDLFKQTSLMIQHGILEMDSIYAMLGPDDKEIEEEAKKEVSLLLDTSVAL